MLSAALLLASLGVCLPTAVGPPRPSVLLEAVILGFMWGLQGCVLPSRHLVDSWLGFLVFIYATQVQFLDKKLSLFFKTAHCCPSENTLICGAGSEDYLLVSGSQSLEGLGEGMEENGQRVNSWANICLKRE